MDVRDLLISTVPGLKEYTETSQYKLSKTILKIRYKLSLDQQEMADKLGISFNEYVYLESGDENIPTERYNKIVDGMLGFLMTSKINNLEDKSVEYGYKMLNYKSEKNYEDKSWKLNSHEINYFGKAA